MIVGLDVSTSVIGISWFSDGGEFRESSHIELTKIEDFYDKCNSFKERFTELCGERNVTRIYVEDKLGGFTMGRTTSQTIMKLAAFNSTVSFIALEITGIRPVHIHPSTIKSIMKNEGLIIPAGVVGEFKKKFVLDWVSKREEHFKVDLTKNGTPKKYMFDRADSYCIAYSGYKKFVCDETKRS